MIVNTGIASAYQRPETMGVTSLVQSMIGGDSNVHKLDIIINDISQLN